MPYIGNTTSDFSIDTGNITNRAVTALKLSPSSVGSNGQVLSVDGSGNLQWSTDSALTLIDEDNMSSNSASSVPSQQSVKAYADTKAVLTGSTNNTITTVTGANAIQGEANLTFDGTTFKVSGGSNTTQAIFSGTGGSGARGLEIVTESVGAADEGVILNARASGTTGRLKFNTNSATAMTILGNGGNVGIGTTSPGSELHVKGSNEILRLETTTTTGGNYINFNDADENKAFVGLGSGVDDSFSVWLAKNSNLRFATNNLERLRIDGSGNVGIGTSSPGTKLDVSGDIRVKSSGVYKAGHNGSESAPLYTVNDADTGIFRGSNSNELAFSTGGTQKLLIASTGQILHTAASGDNQIISKRTNAAGSNGNYFFNFKAQDNNANDVGSFGFHRHSAVDNSRFVIHTRNSGGSNQERLRIDSIGYVGIGTSTSVHRLSIKDTNATNSTVLIDNPIASSTLSGNTAANGYGHALCLENSEETTGNIVSLGFQVRTTSAYSNGAITAKAVDTSGNTQFSVWTESGNAIGERLRIAPDGDLSISDSGAVHGVAKITVIPTNRTSAFDASDGDTWHDLVLHQGGSATNNAVGIAFQLKNDGSYHKNAGTGIAAVKNGTNNDYGSDLVFITRGQSTAATEKARLLSSGGLTFNGDTSTDNALDDYEEGNLSWQLRKSGSTSTGNDNGSLIKYTKVGRMVCISGRIRTDSTPGDANDNFYMSGTLPFTPSTPGTAVVGHWRSQDQTDSSLTASISWGESNTTIYLYTIDSKADYSPAQNNVPASNQTNLVATFSLTYQST